MNLAETESLFTASLEPRCSAAQRARAIRLIDNNGRIPAELGLTIYRNNVSGALIKALPQEDPTEVFWRFHFMVGTMAYTLGMGHLVEEYSGGVANTRDLDRVAERLVRFLTAGMAAGVAR